MILSGGEQKQKRLAVMRKGIVSAAMTIDRKFREEYGDPVYRSEDVSKLRAMKNPYAPSSPYRVAMVTLTYRPDVGWSPKHVTELLQHYRMYFKRRKLVLHYVWGVELQGNGKPHYHVIMWLPKGITPPLPDKQGWWPHGMSNAKFVYSAAGYVAKYASKAEGQSGHHLPKRARLWGHGGLKLFERAPIAYAVAPRWLKHVIHPDSHPRRKTVVLEGYRTLKGEVLNFKNRVSAWVLTAGEAVGWAFCSPYRFDDFIPDQGIALSHLGVIQAMCPDGGEFFIPHKG